jgi:hypothetical protein
MVVDLEVGVAEKEEEEDLIEEADKEEEVEDVEMLPRDPTGQKIHTQLMF